MRNFRVIFQCLIIIGMFLCSHSLFAFPLQFAKGMSWNYLIKLNGQPFIYSNVRIVDQEKLPNQNIWTIKEDSIYKVKVDKDHHDEYRSQTIMKLRDDFTLVSRETIVKINDICYSSNSIKEIDCGYAYSQNIDGVLSAGNIDTKEPLFFYDCTTPWLIEKLIKNNLLTPQKSCSAISFPDEILLIEYSKELSSVNDEEEFICYVAGNDKIYVNMNRDVIKIDSMDKGIIEVMFGEDISEVELVSYDMNKNVHISSNVLLLNRDYLTTMTAYLNIEQVFNNVDYLQISTSRQKFTGTVTEERIEGEITIVREITKPKTPFTFPVTVEWGPRFEKYLESHPLIEADDPEIIAKANEITKNARDTWEAALAIVRWVNRSIEYNHSGNKFSALGVLKSGKGVCGQFSTLTAALCRAVRIPTRYITGYAYANSINAFGPHAWIEVYIDETGWRSMDPTWGQFEFIDPTHIGICDAIYIEGNSNSLKPGIIKILEYAPKQAGPMAPPPVNIKRLEFGGKKWYYKLFNKSSKIGDYTAQLTAISKDNFCLLESLDLWSKDTHIKSELTLDRKGYVLNYSSIGISEGQKIEREVFYDKNIKYRGVLGENEVKKEVPRIFQNEVQTDLLRFVQWGLVAARVVKGVKAETTKTVTVFSANSFQNSNLDVSIKPCKFNYRGRDVKGWFCEIIGGQYKTKLHITKDLVITKIELPEIEVTAFLVD